jgi:hypothetical protein
MNLATNSINGNEGNYLRYQQGDVWGEGILKKYERI